MERDTTNSEEALTEDELRAAGASALFVAYYREAGEGASARREVENGPFSLDKLNENPQLGGGFFAALWNGDESGAFARADSRNLAILEAATGKDKATALGWETA